MAYDYFFAFEALSSGILFHSLRTKIMAQRVNNVNLEEVGKFAKKIQDDPKAAKQIMVIEGEWSLHDESYSYRSNITYGPDNKKTTFTMDHAIFAGGSGNLPAPLQFGYFWIASCTAGTFAIVSGLMGITLKRLKTRVEASLDWQQVFGGPQKPIVTGVKITFEVQSDAPAEKLKEVEKAVMENCPAIYTLKNPIPTTSEMLFIR